MEVRSRSALPLAEPVTAQPGASSAADLPCWTDPKQRLDLAGTARRWSLNVSLGPLARMWFGRCADAIEASPHLCAGARPQEYTGQVELVPPAFMARDDGRGICVDVCLALEVSQLWRLGIRTTGCCCGHGEHPAYIGVADEHIETMKRLGYAVQPNPCRPGAEDSFHPLTPLQNPTPDA